MAQHDRDTAAESHDAPETTAGEVWTTTSVERPAEAERSEGQAISAPVAEPVAPAKQRRKNWHRFTLLAATLGLLATAGSIAAYRFRDKHEKLAAFATAVDETFARPEKLVSALRDNVVKWTGEAEKPAQPAKAPAPIDLGKADTSAPAPVPPMEAKPPEPAAPPRSSGDRITWAAPGSTPAPAPAPVAPAPAAAPEPPAKPLAEAKPTAALSNEPTEALARRVDELERIAREALALAEQARSGAAAAAGEAPRVNPKLQDIEDNVGGLEGRIDWLSDRLDQLREKLEAPKGETRVAREAVEPPPPPPAEPAKGPDPTNILVVVNSLQRALDRGAPYASELAALAAQGADPEALAALAPSAKKGAPDARALRVSFHSLTRNLEESAELKPDAPLADRLLHGASKLVKIRTAAEKEKASIGEIAAKVEAALDRGEIEAALATFGEFPDDAKTVAREWEETARRRIAAETAAASILSGALDALAKSKN
ncbi:COG4223 family protein [Methylosinus sp. Ce-a6]|uniref:COG4223 family protein n=1 Tax=Methylosinus sp. Ce-a6 TaxID=2172005 RepID=UPI00135AAF35|nr:hypothetical protein [Methylosinus sp. Ce-a6]